MKYARFNIGFDELPYKPTLNIYVTGCKKNCPNCHNAQLKDYDVAGSKTLDMLTIRNELEKCHGFTNYVCWLGGDIMDNPDWYGYLKFITMLKGYNIVYTGYSFDQLPTNLFDVALIVKHGSYDGHSINEPETAQRFYIPILNKHYTYIEIYEDDKIKELKKKTFRDGGLFCKVKNSIVN